jgi:hypothetical protein
MGFFVPEEGPLPVAPAGVAPPTPRDPMLGEAFGAAFRQDNPMVSLARRLAEERFPAEPHYDPLSDLDFKGSKYEQTHADAFVASRSPGETRSIMRRIDQEDEDRKTLDAAGFPGWVAQVAAGTIDPTIALPAGAVYRSAKGGYSAARSALGVGTAAGLQTAAQEAVLQATQETRTAAESATAIGSATVLGGLIGGGAASLLSRAERQAVEKLLDKDRADLSAHAEGVPMPAAAGAAAVDERQLEMFESGLGVTKRVSPTRFVLSGQSVEARRVVADAFETPYSFKGDEGPNGPALDRIAKMQIDGTRTVVSDELDRLFIDYRGAPEGQSFPRFRAQMERFMGGERERMTFHEYKQEIAKAMREGDQHELPQVSQAAQFIRRSVFEPWRARAQKLAEQGVAGFEGFKDGALPFGAESYFHRVWNKEAVSAKRPEVVDRFADWLRSDQQTKAASKERLIGLNRDLQGVEDALSKAKSEDRAAALTIERDALRARVEDEIAAWEGKSTREAKSALKAREKYAAQAEREADAARLGGADSAIDKTVKKIIESERDLSDIELRGRAQEIVDRILGTPDGRLPYDAHTGGPDIGVGGNQRGPIAARQFAIPDRLISDLLENDVEQVIAMHLRTMVPDILLTEKFGDVRMTEPLKRITDEYAQLSDAARGSEKRQKQIKSERDAVIERIAGMRDRMRGVYGWSADTRNMARVANAAKNINNLTSMGMAAVSSLSDMAGALFRFGITATMRDGWAPYFRELTAGNEAFKQFKGQMRAIGIGVETTINARQHSLDDVMDVYKPQSRVERALQATSDKFFIANMLAPETDAFKTIVAHVAVSEYLRWIQAVVGGKATKAMMRDLTDSGISPQMAARIHREFFENGKGAIIDGVRLPNTADWSDRAAADAFNGAVARETDIAVVTPGQEKPLTMSKPLWSLLTQFKSFTAAANERVLVANLQRRDARTLQGLIGSIALGMLAYKANSVLSGQPTSDRPADWFKEGFSRSGVSGWFEEGNSLAAKMTRGGVDIHRLYGADKPLGRNANRSTLDMLIGPTAGKVGQFAQITGAAASGEWTEADTRAIRRLIAGQNLFYVRRLFDQLEENTNGALGVQ